MKDQKTNNQTNALNNFVVFDDKTKTFPMRQQQQVRYVVERGKTKKRNLLLSEVISNFQLLHKAINKHRCNDFIKTNFYKTSQKERKQKRNS